MRMLATISLSTAGALLVVPMLVLAQTKGTTMNAKSAGAQSEAARKFRAYLDADWKRWMEEYPEKATQIGYPGQNARWTDDSPEGIARRKNHLAESLAALKTVSREALPPAEQLNFDLYRELLETEQEGMQFGDEARPFRDVVPHNLYMPLNQMEGIQQGAPEALANTPHQTVADYQTILARLTVLPVAVDQQIAL